MGQGHNYVPFFIIEDVQGILLLSPSISVIGQTPGHQIEVHFPPHTARQKAHDFLLLSA